MREQGAPPDPQGPPPGPNTSPLLTLAVHLTAKPPRTHHHLRMCAPAGAGRDWLAVERGDERRRPLARALSPRIQRRAREAVGSGRELAAPSPVSYGRPERLRGGLPGRLCDLIGEGAGN